MENQRRNADRGQYVADVDHHGHALDDDCSAGARTESHHSCPPLLDIRVVGDGRRVFAEVLGRKVPISPARLDLLDPAPVLLFGPSPWILRRADALCDRVIDGKPGDALRVRCRVHHRHRRSFECCDEHGARRLRGVHHSADVVHARLERRYLANSVG